jgi:hypothetical protein
MILIKRKESSNNWKGGTQNSVKAELNNPLLNQGDLLPNQLIKLPVRYAVQ